MSKEELIEFCRYYQGEAEPPARLSYEHRKLWQYEERWVGMMTSGQDAIFEKFLSDYHRDGLRTLCVKDNVPLTLKAVLYNRYQQHCDGMGDVEHFKEWYTEHYSH